jgi:hypothetical protein
MSATASSRFYWNDWQGDPALRLCSLAAQGLWMRMLCIAAEADPIGYVTIGSKPVGATDLAKIAGASEAEITYLVDELANYGVFSRDKHGRIYSRRMIRDARRAAEAKKNGKMGGNPNIGKQTGKVPGVNPPDNPGDKPPIPVPSPSEEKREAIASPKKKGAPRGSKPKTPIDPDWQPDEQDRKFALARGLDPALLREEFVARHLTNATESADWHASWRTWCLTAVKFAAIDAQRRGRMVNRQGPNSLVAAVRQAVADAEGQP